MKKKIKNLPVNERPCWNCPHHWFDESGTPIELECEFNFKCKNEREVEVDD